MTAAMAAALLFLSCWRLVAAMTAAVVVAAVRKGSSLPASQGQRRTLVLLLCRGMGVCQLLWQHWQQCRCSSNGWH
jgi:hypothetical protein